MIEVKHNGHLIVLNDSIQDIPITRFQTYNLNFMIDAGIGADMDSLDAHYTKILQLKNKPEELEKEILNYRQNIYFMMSHLSPEMNAFAVMVESIDGEHLGPGGYTESGIQNTITRLGKTGITVRVMRSIMSIIKKKIDSDFEIFFPKIFESLETKVFYQKLKQRTLLSLQRIGEQSSEAIDRQINEIDEYILKLMYPKVYGGSEGIEVEMIRGFNQTCKLLTRYQIIIEADKVENRIMTTSFYEGLALLKEILKQERKQKK